MVRTRVVRSKFSLRLVINGVEYKVSHFAMNFALNKIPSATATLAVGRDVRRQRVATIHEHASDLNYMHQAQVYLLPEYNWADENDGLWNQAGTQLIFDGYLTGAGYSKIRGSLRYSVQLIHWLANLNFSSALSSQTHPANAGQFSHRAIYASDTNTSSKPHFIAQSVGAGLFTASNISSDLWVKCLKPMLCKISQSLLFTANASSCGGQISANHQGLEALKRIEGESENCSTPLSPFYKPLALPLGSEQIAKAIAYYVKQQTVRSYWSTTLWDKLVHDFCSTFMFAVVPKVKTAQVVPYTPGLRETWQQSLKSDDIGHIDISSFIPRPLRAVGILSTMHSSTGVFNGTDKSPRRLDVGGCYESKNNQNGLVLFKGAPGWLASVPAVTHSIAKTATGGGRAATGTSTTPVAAGAMKGDDRGKTPSEAYNETEEFYINYARSIYINEVLRGRFGVAHGKLRFDIAPGSNVRIENLAGPHIDSDLLSQNLVGSIVRVTVALNAEKPAAGTSFQLANLRTEKENEVDDTSVEAHPLFSDQKWPGAPLLEEYLFSE